MLTANLGGTHDRHRSTECLKLLVGYLSALSLGGCLTGAGPCRARVTGRSSGWASRPERFVSGAEEEADHCSGAGWQPLHCLHGRAHLRSVTHRHTVLLTG